ncbi:hypothetical protein ES703_109171 [subsurface metagenome]
MKFSGVAKVRINGKCQINDSLEDKAMKRQSILVLAIVVLVCGSAWALDWFVDIVDGEYPLEEDTLCIEAGADVAFSGRAIVNGTRDLFRMAPNLFLIEVSLS